MYFQRPQSVSQYVLRWHVLVSAAPYKNRNVSERGSLHSRYLSLNFHLIFILGKKMKKISEYIFKLIKSIK